MRFGTYILNILPYSDPRRLLFSPWSSTAILSVFLRIQVHASSQTKGLERGWKQRARGSRVSRIRLLRHALPISLLILRKKPTVLQSTVVETFGWVSVKRGFGLGLGLGLGSSKKERPRPRVFLTPVTRWVQGTLGLRGCLQLGNSIITCSVLCTYSAYIFIKPQPFIIETAAQIVSLVLTN